MFAVSLSLSRSPSCEWDETVTRVHLTQASSHAWTVQYSHYFTSTSEHCWWRFLTRWRSSTKSSCHHSDSSVFQQLAFTVSYLSWGRYSREQVFCKGEWNWGVGVSRMHEPILHRLTAATVLPISRDGERFLQPWFPQDRVQFVITLGK